MFAFNAPWQGLRDILGHSVPAMLANSRSDTIRVSSSKRYLKDMKFSGLLPDCGCATDAEGAADQLSELPQVFDHVVGWKVL